MMTDEVGLMKNSLLYEHNTMPANDNYLYNVASKGFSFFFGLFTSVLNANPVTTTSTIL